ncbi:MAG: hypothetical protein ACOX5J_09210 [Candidatus Hydrogenedentales bacterium]|jgi:hypothetical protein
MNVPETAPNLITKIFKPVLQPFFDPINDFLGRYYMPWATICALGVFFSAMVGVFLLRKEYVNVDAPKKGFFYDLRVWTIFCMLPHVLVYLYFSKWS